jgi:MFS transporter, DHA2 family, multidrug resistance protein
MAASTEGASPRSSVAADGLPVPRRYWAILAIALGVCMSVLDSTIANVALPTIARDFGAEPAAAIWVINAYQLAILVLLLPLAALGEIVGFRRVAQCGLMVFTLGSLACACAPSLLTLSMARVLQGVGAAGVMSVSPALVRFTYPHSQLGRAVGINTFVVATSAALGPTLASAILAVAQWRWLFAVNLPIGLLAVSIAFYALPTNPRARHPFNLAGAVLYAGALGLILSGLQSLAHAAATPLALLEVGSGSVLGVLLVRHELPRAVPIVPIDLVRIPMFSLSVLTSVCSFIAGTAALIALPFELQRLGHSAVATGLLMTPWPLALAVAAPLAGRLADQHHPGLLGGGGLLVLTLGLTLLALFPASGTPAGFAWRMGLCGLGFGFFQAPNNRTLLAAAPRVRSGAAGGMLAVARLLGQSLGAVGIALLFRAFGAIGSRYALWMSALLALIGAIVSSLRLSATSSERSP